MNSCCSTSPLPGTSKFFSDSSKKYLKRFKRRGLAKEQGYLLEGMTQSSVAGKSILEIGCGVGGLHLSILQQGAAKATGIDLSDEMLDAAKKLSAELGLAGRTTYLLGDFAAMNGEAPASDIVILDKVVCCYENMDGLLRKSLRKTGATYAISFPRPWALSRMMVGALILRSKILRMTFRPFWHDWDRMVGAIRSEGFSEVYSRDTLVWAVRVFSRDIKPDRPAD